ncbi:MAG: leucine-rich repeat protein [Muribaculaceae bacterium]|nr:leucine-rich repeat protein [Muribaculaceae bacterium]
MKHRLSLLILMVATFAMTASAYTYYSNVEIGNFKYSQLALGSSSSEENVAYLKGLSSTASTSLTTLDIPGYVTYNGNRYRVTQINQQAFENNTKITTVNFGYGVENINGYVFNGCTSLKYVNLPSSVKEIGQFVFQNCTSLLVVAFAGEKAPKIYDYTFNLSSTSKRASTATYRGMNALKADANWLAAFGADNIKRHYNYTVGDFKVYSSTNGCWQYYMIKNGVPYNGNSSNPAVRSSCVLVGATFTDGSNNKISLPQSVSNSDNNAPGGYKFYGVADSAFMNNTAIKEVVNNNTMAYKIGVRSFYGCSSLTSADVPVDTIGDYAFYNCSNLATVNFATSLSNLVYLGSYAFGKCNLSDVTIPKTVMAIGYAPFYINSSLTNITVNADNPNYSSYKGSLYNKSQTMLYQIPGNWSQDSGYDLFPETLKRILQYSAAGSRISSIYLPYNVTILEQYAFQNCKNLELVHFPSSVTTVNVNAFAGCDAINRVELNFMTPPPADLFPAVTNKSNVAIYMPYGSYSAYAASSIWKQYNRKTGIYDHTNCWDIFGNQVYYSVTSTTPHTNYGHNYDGTVKVVRISAKKSDRVKIYDGCYYADNSKSYEITAIGPYAGDRDNQFFIDIGAPHVTVIEENAFRDSKITDFSGFACLEHIGDYAFYNTTLMGFGDLGYPEHLQTIGKYAFYNSGIRYHKTTRFIASSTLTSIGEYAFYNCSTLSELFLRHIDGKNPLTCGTNFFGNNAEDFKCWVDYRQLGDYLNSTKWDGSKIYPHLCFDNDNDNDSLWQSFACVKPIDFEGTGLEVYRIDVYDQATQRFILQPIIHLYEREGALVHGNGKKYYRLNYATNNLSSCSWLQAVTDEPHTVVSNNTTSYYYFGGTDIPRFDLIRTNKTITRGHAYVKMKYSDSGGVGTIYTNLGGSAVVPGDVNGDGRVNVSDVSALINMILGITPMDQTAGDVNGDGRVNVSDVSALINIILGIS